MIAGGRYAQNIILELKQRSDDNVVGTFIRHFISKHSSEILKANLKIQQSKGEVRIALEKQDSISVGLSR